MNRKLPILFTLLMVTAQAFAAESPVIRAGSEMDFRPYCFTDAKGQPTGFGPDLLKAVAAKMGLQLQITPAPWDQVWGDLVAGNLDVLPVVARTPGREPLVEFSLPHTETFDAFFIREGRPPIQDLAGAAGKEIVVLREDAAHHQLAERKFTGTIIPVESIPDGLRLVAAGKHDAFLCSKMIGLLECKKADIRGIVSGPLIPDYKRTFSFAVPKGNTELLEKLNQGLRIVKTDGTYDEIYRRWLDVEDPWRKWVPYIQWAVAVATVLAGLVIMLQWLVYRRTRELRDLTATLEQRVADRTAELCASERRLNAVLQQMPAGVGLLDRQGRWVLSNPIMEAFVPKAIPSTLPDRVGRWRVFDEAKQPIPPENWPGKRALRGETVSPGLEAIYTDDDGRERWMRVSAAPLRDDAGAILGATCVVQDITTHKQAEEILRKGKDELEVRVQERTEELANSQKRLQQLASQLLMAQEKERKWVARELHDGLMSELAATKFLLEGKVALLEKGGPVVPGELRRVADILGGAMREARRLMNNLHPSTLDDLGLIATINMLCLEYQKSYSDITVQKEIAAAERDIPAEIKLVIYRLLQEALNNFARHGKGDKVVLSLRKSDGMLVLMTQDNGQGFDVENQPKGLGLESMRERVELSGGDFQIESTIGQGTTIRATWSLQ